MPLFTAFAGDQVIASGDEAAIRRALRGLVAAFGPVLLFDDETGRQVDIDLRDPAPEPSRRAGRPRLGVASKEVTLLPRHWEWLARQPGGASVTLRKLVEAARRQEGGARQGQDAAYHFLSVMAGDRPGYEEAIRALYAGDMESFGERMNTWPAAIRDHAMKLATGAFA